MSEKKKKRWDEGRAENFDGVCPQKRQFAFFCPPRVSMGRREGKGKRAGREEGRGEDEVEKSSRFLRFRYSTSAARRPLFLMLRSNRRARCPPFPSFLPFFNS